MVDETLEITREWLESKGCDKNLVLWLNDPLLDVMPFPVGHWIQFEQCSRKPEEWIVLKGWCNESRHYLFYVTSKIEVELVLLLFKPKASPAREPLKEGGESNG